MITTNPLLQIFDEMNGDESLQTFDFTEKLLTTAVKSSLEQVRELYTAYMKMNNARTVFISDQAKVMYQSFITSGRRIAAYDATQWKKVKAVVDFIGSDSNDCNIHVFGEMITLITQSKFVDIPSVMTLAIPTNDVFEVLAKIDSRYHQLVRLIADVLSKKDQEQQNSMTFPESDWSNSLLVAQQVMKFPIAAVEAI